MSYKEKPQAATDNHVRYTESNKDWRSYTRYLESTGRLSPHITLYGDGSASVAPDRGYKSVAYFAKAGK